MALTGSYQEYVELAIEQFARRDERSRYLLVDAVADKPIRRVLDIGCGAGQELIPFLEKTGADCFGIDAADELGAVGSKLFAAHGFSDRFALFRALAENLPFAPASFDVVLCRVALPYMNNRRAIAEVARVLRGGGVFLLKTHAPAFYTAMVRERWKTLSLKQLAYPLICLAGSAWHQTTGWQLEKGFWKGKEVFQTEKFLQKECAKNGLRIEGFLPDNNPLTPSYKIIKHEY